MFVISHFWLSVIKIYSSSVLLTLVLSHDEKLGVSESSSGPVTVPGQCHGGLQHLHRRPGLLVLLDRGEGSGVVSEDAAVDAAHTAGQAALTVLEAGLL